MAHLAGSPDRGQVILIAAFALAVMFIALALVVNSAIFTENLATRGESTGGTDALLYRYEVQQSVENVTRYVNEHNTTGLVDKVENSTQNISVQGGVQNAQQGRIVTASVDRNSALVNATLRNNDTSDYTNATGVTDWQLANNASNVSAASFNVTDVSASDTSSAFHLYVNDTDSSDWWSLSVNDTEISDQYNVTIADHNAFSGSCEFLSNDHFFLNLTDGEVRDTSGSAHCTTLLVADNRTYRDFDHNAVNYTNADNIEGNYSLLLNNTGASPGIRTQNFDGTSPVATVWIPTLDVSFTYETASLEYDTTFAVNASEPDD